MTATPPARRPSRLPIFYFSFAHLALLLACLLVAWDPQAVLGFFYHPWMMVPVHLVTLGWLSASIVGGLYMVAPMALRTQLTESRADTFAFVAYVLGLWGMVAHFWIDSYGGMVWSVLWLVYVFMLVGWRAQGALRRARVPLGVKLHVLLAFINLLGVATLGIVMGFIKVGWMAFGAPLSNVAAHFHLAAVGWVLMMILGMAYRLLPMILPTAMPPDAFPLASAILLELGALGLASSWLLDWPSQGVAGLLVTAGVGVFVAAVVWMLRHRRTRAKGLPKVDAGVLQVAQGFLYLVAALGLGLYFVHGSWDEVTRLDWIPVYGVVILLGFGAQLVLGMGARLFPLYGWLLAMADSEDGTPPASPHELTWAPLRWWTLIAWTVGVPLLAWAFLRQQPETVAVAALLLGSAVLASGVNFWRALREGRRSVEVRRLTVEPSGVR